MTTVVTPAIIRLFTVVLVTTLGVLFPLNRIRICSLYFWGLTEIWSDDHDILSLYVLALRL